MSDQPQTANPHRGFLNDLFVDDIAQKMHINRAAVAVGYGLEPCHFTRPYPGSSTNITYQSAQTGGLVKALALGAALLGTGGIGAAITAGALWWSSQKQTTAPEIDAQDARVRVFWGDKEIKAGDVATGEAVTE